MYNVKVILGIILAVAIVMQLGANFSEIQEGLSAGSTNQSYTLGRITGYLLLGAVSIWLIKTGLNQNNTDDPK